MKNPLSAAHARRTLVALLAAGAALLTGLLSGLPAQAQPPAAAVDYGQDAAWLCRPGQAQACTRDLDAMRVYPDGRREPAPFRLADQAPVDCFYVYPTASREPTRHADMAASPELLAVTRAQAGRLASRCRLFVPIYRQQTRLGLAGAYLREGKPDLDGPYDDVRAAWRWYLAHDNHGRRVVLVGHSQGAMLLQRLIAEEIDGKPAQALLLSAFLGGAPSLTTPAGASRGGSFQSVPLCASAAQTGCVYVWGSFMADANDSRRHFGKNEGKLVGACVNPAAPGGGSGLLKAYLPKPAAAPAGDPPWILLERQFSASCQTDALGSVLRVAVEPGAYAKGLQAMLQLASNRPGWGLHRLDLSLTQGNILDLIDAELAGTGSAAAASTGQAALR